jgi:hypothetical protein
MMHSTVLIEETERHFFFELGSFSLAVVMKEISKLMMGLLFWACCCRSTFHCQ